MNKSELIDLIASAAKISKEEAGRSLIKQSGNKMFKKKHSF